MISHCILYENESQCVQCEWGYDLSSDLKKCEKSNLENCALIQN